MRRTLRLAAGWLLVALGVAGLFLPLLQGVVLIAAGLLVLSRHSERLRRARERLIRRFPVLERLGPRRRRGAGPGTDAAAPGPPDPPPQEPGSAGTSTGSPEVSSTTEP